MHWSLYKESNILKASYTLVKKSLFLIYYYHCICSVMRKEKSYTLFFSFVVYYSTVPLLNQQLAPRCHRKNTKNWNQAVAMVRQGR